MDEYQRLSTRERAMGMLDMALIDGVVSACHANKNAMSQPASLGNWQMARIYIEELEQRAQDRHDTSVFTTLKERLAQEFGAPKEQA